MSEQQSRHRRGRLNLMRLSNGPCSDLNNSGKLNDVTCASLQMCRSVRSQKTKPAISLERERTIQTDRESEWKIGWLYAVSVFICKYVVFDLSPIKIPGEKSVFSQQTLMLACLLLIWKSRGVSLKGPLCRIDLLIKASSLLPVHIL